MKNKLLKIVLLITITFLMSENSIEQANAMVGGIQTGVSNELKMEFEDGVLTVSGDEYFDADSYDDFDKVDKLVIKGNVLMGEFSGCTNLKNVVIESEFEDINDCAFEGCTNLVSVKLPDSVWIIRRRAFKGCSKLKTINMPSNLEEIGYNAFEGCEALNNIVFPKGLVEIGDYAFRDCLSITSISIPESVEILGDGVFAKCMGLKSFIVSGEIEEWGQNFLGGCDNLEKLSIDRCWIEWYELHDLPKLVNISMSSQNEHYTCVDGIVYSRDKKRLIHCPISKSGAVKIPTGVTEIGCPGFSGCNKITSLYIPSSVSMIDTFSLKHCDKITEFSVDIANKSYTTIGGVIFSKDKSTLIQFPSGKSGDYIVPHGTKYIGMASFYECDKVTSITLAETVREIRYLAFGECDKIKNVYLNEGLEKIEFGGISQIESIYIPKSVKELEHDSICWNTEILCENNSYAHLDSQESPSQLYKVIKSNQIISNCTVSISQPSFGYTGDYIKPVVKVTTKVNGKTKTLTNWKDYKVTYQNFKNPGTARIIVTGRGDYVGVAYATFTIRPIDISKATVTIGQPSFAYTGKYIKPVVTVKATVGGELKTLTNWEDYKVTYKNFKNPGQASITVNGIGGCSGSKTIKFYIRPSQVKNVKYIGRSTSYVNFKWDKCVGVTGYEVYRSTSKTGTYTKVGTVSATSFKNTGLKKGTTYYYKVRAYKTVGSTKLYGAYSGVYTIATR